MIEDHIPLWPMQLMLIKPLYIKQGRFLANVRSIAENMDFTVCTNMFPESKAGREVKFH